MYLVCVARTCGRGVVLLATVCSGQEGFNILQDAAVFEQTLVPWAALTMGGLGSRLVAILLGSPEVAGQLLTLFLDTSTAAFHRKGSRYRLTFCPCLCYFCPQRA